MQHNRAWRAGHTATHKLAGLRDVVGVALVLLTNMHPLCEESLCFERAC